MVAPVLPWLTDTAEHLDALLRELADAGATGVTVLPLHLRGSVKPWYLDWLAREHPALVGRYRRLYATGAYVPAEYKEWLRARTAPLLRCPRVRASRRAAGRRDPRPPRTRRARSRPAACPSGRGGSGGSRRSRAPTALAPGALQTTLF